jgi:DMSO/TMAO reductase YedYZ molybdopterin-dependent catalytic subunit
MSDSISRRDALRLSLGGLAAGALAVGSRGADGATQSAGGVTPRPFLTEAKDFTTVSRGNPQPYTLQGEALVQARLTAASWRLEIVAEDGVTMSMPRRLEDDSAIDYAALMALGKKRGVRFLKAMQCNNIELPLGQGLWEGVPLRDVLALCGASENARRLYYYGFHNDDPKQMFRSSLAMNQVLDTPPGDLPPFVAYRLNGAPIPLERGGPVRMVVPWAHGFKSVKWLQKIILTNRFEANDTYAEWNNDPESYLKTAAYFDKMTAATYAAGRPVTVGGTAMVGWPGLERVECWPRPDTGSGGKLAESDAAWATAVWQPAAIEPPPQDFTGALPGGVLPKDVWGFNADGRPKEWPMRFSIAHWSLTLGALKAGRYELRVRTVDKNGFAQPNPRPGQRSGKNMIQCRVITVA